MFLLSFCHLNELELVKPMTSDDLAHGLAFACEKFIGFLEVKQRKINQEEAKVKSLISAQILIFHGNRKAWVKYEKSLVKWNKMEDWDLIKVVMRVVPV